MIEQQQRALILLVAGFTAWSIAFVVLYGLQALGCTYGWPHHRALLIGAYGISLVPLLWLALQRVATKDEAASTLAVAAVWANRSALAAGILVFLPVTFASACI